MVKSSSESSGPQQLFPRRLRLVALGRAGGAYGDSAGVGSIGFGSSGAAAGSVLTTTGLAAGAWTITGPEVDGWAASPLRQFK